MGHNPLLFGQKVLKGELMLTQSGASLIELLLNREESRDKLIFMLDQDTTLTLLSLEQKHSLLPAVRDCPDF